MHIPWAFENNNLRKMRGGKQSVLWGIQKKSMVSSRLSVPDPKVQSLEIK